MATLIFKPKQVTKKLLGALQERARDVINSRYGLGKETRRMTLESIGKKYGITRERVRQIENHAISNIRKSEAYKKEKESFKELEDFMHTLGGVVSEDDLLNHLAKDRSTQNHIFFMLVIGDQFTRTKEDDHFKHRWHVDDKLSEKVHTALHSLYKNLKDEDIVSELDIINKFISHVEEVEEKHKDHDVIRRWLRISKKIDKNPLGEWGLASSPNIKAKGMRDYAFLVIRRHGSPIHFREVAKAIEQLFGKRAHVATCHNELIKDSRFVLVGRGLYALAEWGYISGVVKDVIKKVIEKNGPLTKKDIIDKVLKERYVKENTIVVNLQNPSYFRKDKEGRYSIA